MKKIGLLIIMVLSCHHIFADEIISIKLSDGDSISGRLEFPHGNEDIPLLVIFVHGTGPNTYLNKRKIGNIEFNYFDLFAAEFNKRNIGFFTYNRRGVTLGDTPPYYDKIDSAKYSKYLPFNEVRDVESIISHLKNDGRFSKTKIVLLGCSEGTIIASMVADRKIEKVDALLLFGYVNENLSDVLKWQYSGKASLINLRKYFDSNRDNIIQRNEYESTEEGATIGRSKLFRNADFASLDLVKDSVIDYKDFEVKLADYYEYLMLMIDAGNNNWVWNNYFRVTTRWLKEHFLLEANKTRLLRIDISIYIFHGIDDGNVPVEGVYDIQDRFKSAGKENLQCYIFEGHNHDLNYLQWQFERQIPEGLDSIFCKAELLFK